MVFLTRYTVCLLSQPAMQIFVLIRWSLLLPPEENKRNNNHPRRDKKFIVDFMPPFFFNEFNGSAKCFQFKIDLFDWIIIISQRRRRRRLLLGKKSCTRECGRLKVFHWHCNYVEIGLIKQLIKRKWIHKQAFCQQKNTGNISYLIIAIKTF